MNQLLLLSLVIATFAIPMRAAGDRSAVRGLRRAVVAMAVTVLMYVLAIIFVLPRIS